MHPTINPIKIDFVCIGKANNRKFNNLLNIKTPIKPPNAIGNKNLKLFFISLKKFKIEFTSFS